jgi:ketosteroid isomerase-like protein
MVGGKLKYVIAAAAVVLAVLAVRYFFPSDEVRIGRHFKAISEAGSREKDDKQLTLAMKSKRVAKYFAERCRFDVPAYDLTETKTPEEISGYALAALSGYTEVTLDFYDLSIMVAGDRAEALTTARLVGNRTDGVKVAETHEVACELVKTEEGWRIEQVSAVTVLEK